MQDHATRVLTLASSSSGAAQSRLVASWHRSLVRHGLDPARQGQKPELDTELLKDQREALGRMLMIASPKLDDLHAMIGHCGCGILLADAQGFVLDSRKGAADVSTFDSWGLTAGADWSEAAQGTNGIGTCVTEVRSVTIHRDQHFLSRNIGMSCIDAPIFGPDGQLVAALDVSSARARHTEGFNRLIEAMVARVAQQIEAELFRDIYEHHRIVLAGGTDPAAVALLAVDGDDIVVGATRGARRQLGFAGEGMIQPRPLSDVLGQNSDAAALESAEKAAVMRALTRTGGNVSEAARALGLGRATLYRRMKRLGISESRGNLSQH